MPSTHFVRLALAAVVTAGTGVLAGCPPTPPPLSQKMPAALPVMPTAPVVGTEPVASGIYESLGTTQPLTGAALERGRLGRAEILEMVKAKRVPSTRAATTAPATGPAGPSADREPPPLAVKYYLQGREHFLRGANSEAMDALEKALQLDPDAFTVLRLMGRVCFAASQLARGSMYLERAQSLNPNDVEVNYLLGRYLLERKELDRAVYHLALAADSPEQLPTSTQLPLSAFYLARALQADGFHRAAAKEFERFIELAGLPVPGYRYDRELGYLIDEQWASHLAAAENLMRVGDTAGAIPHYLSASASQPRDLFIASRLINALVQGRQLDAARITALTLLATLRSNEEAITLAGWTYRAIGREGELAADISRRLAATAGAEDPSVSLTLAAVQEYLGEKGPAFATLQKFLSEHPTQLNVLSRLLERVETAATFQAGLTAAAAAIAADTSLAEPVVKRFQPVAESAAAAAFLAKSRGSFVPTFSGAYLLALTLRAQNAPVEEVDAGFRAALALAPEFAPARDAYVGWLLTQERFVQASQLVQQAVTQQQENPKSWELLIESEAAQQRVFSALKIAQDARQKFPANPDIRLQLAALYRLRGQTAEADLELQGLINDSPKFEPGYRALINDLSVRSRRGAAGRAASDTAMNALVTALAKLNRELPESRFGQLSTATFFARSGRLEEAEQLLKRLLTEMPDDPEVVPLLAQVRQLLGRPTEAVATLKKAIDARPQPELVRSLVSLYLDQDKAGDALILTRQMLDAHPTVEAYLLLHTTLLASQDKSAEAIELLAAAQKTSPRSYPIALALSRLQRETGVEGAAVATLQGFIRENGETTERLYALAHLYSAAGDDAASLTTLQRVLAVMPDHIGANNDLGYFWADKGIHLDQSERMIKKALENQPNNPAFVDSLGWLYYKQGRFVEAAATLEKAVEMPRGSEPEVIQHLADALYRTGRPAEAIERWSQALQQLTIGGKLTPDEQKLRTYLEKIIADARAGKAPSISAAAEAPGPEGKPGGAPSEKAAGPATAPAAAPQ